MRESSDGEIREAENTVNCACTDISLTEHFEKELENRLPVRRPWITFTKSKENPTTVTAMIPAFTTTEVLIHLKETFEKTVTSVSDSICKVENAIAKGCYHCPQGAQVQISCATNGAPTMATIQCEDQFYTVPCKQQGAQSILRFSHPAARVRKQCSVACGTVKTSFEITGILQWVRTIHGSVTRILAGESKVYDEMILPDINHILDVMWQSYKILAVAGGLLLLAIITGYLCFWSCGCKIIFAMCQIAFAILRNVGRVIKFTVNLIVRSLSQARGEKKLL